MKLIDPSLSLQVKSLSRQGWTMEQISQGLDISLDELKGLEPNVKDSQKEELENLVKETLVEVCKFSQNDSARVAAAKILKDEVIDKLEKSNNSNFNYEEWIDKMKRVKDGVIEIEKLETCLN